MPLLASSFAAPRGLRGGPVQTVLPSFLRRRWFGWGSRERLELADGDFLELRWIRQGGGRLVVLSHGLGGSVDGVYVRGMAETLRAAGWDVLAWNYRGCGGEENRLMRSYHSGESDDLRAVVGHAAGGYEAVALVGFSLGGNISLKFAGEATVPSVVAAVVAVSAPVDLASSARRLDQDPGNQLYRRLFLKGLIGSTLAKARRFPELGERLAGRDGVVSVRTIREFDERITAPVHGFADAADYYERSSALRVVEGIRVPSLLLNARDDSFLDEPSFPEEVARAHRFLFLEAPRHGGHVGFVDFRAGFQPWHERRILWFLEEVMGKRVVNA